MLRRFTLTCLLLISGYCLLAQGSISGTVKDAKTGEAIIGANVLIDGTSIGAAADVEGKFDIPQVQAGTYTLKISSITYKTHVVENVIIENGKKVTLDIQLSEDVSTLQEVVVQAQRQTDTDFELIRSIKESRLVVVGVTAEQISRSLDRDAAQVLRRVPGITIVDNQFVQIRGLSARYNVVMLHNAYAPSVETDVRSFSFAGIPSSQLDRILVFKSASADLPGDFAGGVVKVFTKSIPDENSVVLDYSTQYRTGTTFGSFYHQQYDPLHVTSFNTKYYSLPANFPSDLSAHSEAARDAYGQTLKNNWAAQKSTAIPDQRFTITFNRKMRIGKVDIGNISAINYSNSYTRFNMSRGDYSVSNGELTRGSTLNDKQYSQTIRTGALFNWSFRWNNNNHVDFKNLYNVSSLDQYVDRTGTANGNSFNKVYSSIYSGQLMGTHELFADRTTLEWVTGYNNSSRQQPDYKRYFYSLDGATGSRSIIVPNNVDPNNLGRFYGSLNESAYTAGLSVKQRFAFTEDPLKSPELKAGFFFEDKSRNFAARNLGYTWASGRFDHSHDQDIQTLPPDQFFSAKNLNPTTLSLGEDTKRKDSYRATNRLFAYYLMASIPLNKFKVDAGARVEDNNQQLHSFDDLHNMPVNPQLHKVKVLPSANVSYNFTSKMLVRGAYAKTVNRPEFRELAPFGFYDFNFNFLYQGNQYLTMATIQNVDLRWEYYPTKNEQITFGGFYKDFKNPIEIYNGGNGGGIQLVSFDNAKSALSYGVEVEVKKSLSGISSSKILNNLSLLFNATLIKSTVKQNQSSLTIYEEKNRPMQGQAPYVVNAGLFYSTDNGWQINGLYNVVGPNIFIVGNQQTPSIYAMPRNVVDLIFNKKLSEKLQIKGGVSDIFNQPIRLREAGADGKIQNSGNNLVQYYKPGRVFSIGFSWKVM